MGNNKAHDNPPCNHFSIRGYVARMRQENLKICSPFPVNESEAQPSLPPLVVPRFQSWSCSICQGENEFNITEKSNNNLGVTDHDPSLENNLSQVSNARTSKVCPGLTQEMHANDRGNVASDVELVTSNLNTKVNDHARDMHSNVENEVQDHDPKRYAHKFAKRHKRMRFLEEILRKDDEPNHQLIGQGGETNPSTSAISGKGALVKKNDGAKSAKNMKSNNVLTADNDVSNQFSLAENEIAATLLGMKLLITNMENVNLSCSADTDPLNKPSKERDFDLNIPYFDDDTTDQEMLNRDIDLGTSSKANEDNVVELHSNQGISIDLNSTDTGSSDPVHKRILNLGESSNPNMDIDSHRKNFYPCERSTELPEGDQLSDKSHDPTIFGKKLIDPPVPLNVTSENYCGMNRNPAEFTAIEPRNPYMMEKKDEVRKRVREERHGSSSKQNRKSKKR